MKKNISGIIFLMLIVMFFSCKKETLDDMTLTDGMIVFNLDGKDWIVKDIVASYSDFTGTGGGEVISLLGSVQVGLDTYKSISISVKDLEYISEMNYNFSTGDGTGAWIQINEGKTPDSGILYYSINPEDGLPGKGNVRISVFNRGGSMISGNFNGEIFKSNYTNNQTDEWIKTTIKSGRFQNIPVIIGK